MKVPGRQMEPHRPHLSAAQMKLLWETARISRIPVAFLSLSWQTVRQEGATGSPDMFSSSPSDKHLYGTPLPPEASKTLFLYLSPGEPQSLLAWCEASRNIKKLFKEWNRELWGDECGLTEEGQLQLQRGKVRTPELAGILWSPCRWGGRASKGDVLHGSPIFLKAFSQNVLHHRLMYKTWVVSGKLAKSFGNCLKGRKQRVAVKRNLKGC